MTRSNKSNSEYAVWIKHRPPIAQLGNVGLGVFRSFEASQFDPVFYRLQEVLGDAVIRVRGQGMEKPPGVNLLEISEVKRQKALGRVPVQEAINEVYESVGSLRRGVTAIPSRVQLLGRGFHRSAVLAAMFDDGTEDQLKDERRQILETLEELAEPAYEFIWLPQRPHIGLARLVGSQVEKASLKARYMIAESLPPTVALHRATIYNPSHNYRRPPTA